MGLTLAAADLATAEAELRRALASGDHGGLDVLGYGEISTVIAVTTPAGRFALKRLPPFGTRARYDAYRGLFASDLQVRGTALEYLEAILPEEIRRAIWPFLEDRRSRPAPHRSRDEIVRDLLASEATIALDLKRLRRPTSSDGATPDRDREPG